MIPVTRDLYRYIYPRISRYDFFLVSQSVRQGTVNPTSYNVIKAGAIQGFGDLLFRLQGFIKGGPSTLFMFPSKV